MSSRRRDVVEGPGRRGWLLAVVSVTLGVAYFGWRLGWTLRGSPWWWSLPVLLVEVFGAVGTALLLFAHAPSRRRHRRTHGDGGVLHTGEMWLDTDALAGLVDVIVRVDAQPELHVHATLAGVRHQRRLASITVLTCGDTESDQRRYGDHDVDVIGAGSETGSSVIDACRIGGAPFVLLLDAGDVPLPGCLDGLLVVLGNPSIAVVQAGSASSAHDSAEHDSSGRHQLRFERESLAPALARRRSGVVSGSGTLVRRSVLHDVACPDGLRRPSELRWSLRLARAGSVVAVMSIPSVAVAAINTESEVARARRQQAHAALSAVRSADGPLWGRGLSIAQRAGFLAWMVRPLAGVRRALLVVAVVVMIVSGSIPINPSTRPGWTAAMIGAGLGAAAAASIALRRASGGALRAGDRLRSSLTTMGSGLAAFSGPGPSASGNGVTVSYDRKHRSLLQAPTMALVMLAGCATMMAVDRSLHIVQPIPTAERAVVLVLALWLIGGSLTAMRCLARPQQRRAVRRHETQLSALLLDDEVVILDLSPKGALVHRRELTGTGPSVGDEVDLWFEVPIGFGELATVEAIGVVRSSRVEADGQLIGIEIRRFVDDGLAVVHSYCYEIAEWSLEHLAAGIAEVTDSSGSAANIVRPGRGGARVAGLVALLGIAATTAPPFVVASAASPIGAPTQWLAVTVVDDRNANGATDAADLGVGGAVVHATCLIDAGPDRVPGTGDGERFSAPIVATDRGDGHYIFLGVPGSPCRVELAGLPDGTAAGPLGPDHRGGVQFAQAGSTIHFGVVHEDELCHVAGTVTGTVAGTGRACASMLTQVGGRVWFDADANGVQDPGERGLAGVSVRVSTDGQNTTVQSAADGSYHIDVAAQQGPEGSIEIHAPTDTLVDGSTARLTRSVSAGAGGDSVVDPATGAHLVATARDRAVHDDLDIGYASSFSLGDLVWNDLDHDGIADPAEPGLDGIQVTLARDDTADSVPDGPPLATATTNHGGRYLFVGLPAGTYLVELEPPPGYVNGASGETGTSVVRSAPVVLGTVAAPTGEVPTQDDLTPDTSSDMTVDVGLRRSLVLTGRVVLDLTNAQSDAESDAEDAPPGVAGIAVSVERDGQVVAETTTDASGRYSFATLTSGVQEVVVVVPPDLWSEAADPLQTADGGTDAGKAEAAQRRLHTGLIDVQPAAAAVEGGSGLVELAPVPLRPRVVIAGSIWADLDGDHRRAVDEVGLGSQAVRLERDGKVIATALSDGGGNYRFDRVLPGEYLVGYDAAVGSTVGLADGYVAAAVDSVAPDGVSPDDGRRSDGRVTFAVPVPRFSAASGAGTGSIAVPPIAVMTPAPAVGLRVLAEGSDRPTLPTRSTITWTYEVTNLGNVPLVDITVIDPVMANPLLAGDGVDCNGDAEGTGQPVALEPGAATTCSAAGRVIAGSSDHEAVVTAFARTGPGDAPTALDPVVSSVGQNGNDGELDLDGYVIRDPGEEATVGWSEGAIDGPPPEVTPTDDADTAAAASAHRTMADGSGVWWLLRIGNVGNDGVVDVTVRMGERAACAGLTLAPGEVRWCRIRGVVDATSASDSGDVMARAEATGTDVANGAPVTAAADETHVYVPLPRIEVSNLVNGVEVLPGDPGPPVAIGSEVNLLTQITNTGNWPIEHVDLVDDRGSPVSCDGGPLAGLALQPGSSVTCSRFEVVVAPKPVPAAVPTAVPTASPADATRSVDVLTAVATPLPPDVGALGPLEVIATTSYRPIGGAIAGLVFDDDDLDGREAAGDAGVPGATLTLLAVAADRYGSAAIDGTPVVATVVSDEHGGYSFVDVAPGHYRIELVPPAGRAVTVIPIPRAPLRSASFDVIVAANEFSVPAPVAVHRTGGITGTAFVDDDGDGAVADVEAFHARRSVGLHDVVGNRIATTMTTDDGSFFFGDLEPGVYSTQVDVSIFGSLPAVDGSGPLVVAAGALRPDTSHGILPGRLRIGPSRVIGPTIASGVALRRLPSVVPEAFASEREPAGIAVLPTTGSGAMQLLVFAGSVALAGAVLIAVRQRRAASERRVATDS